MLFNKFFLKLLVTDNVSNDLLLKMLLSKNSNMLFNLEFTIYYDSIHTFLVRISLAAPLRKLSNILNFRIGCFISCLRRSNMPLISSISLSNCFLTLSSCFSSSNKSLYSSKEVGSGSETFA